MTDIDKVYEEYLSKGGTASEEVKRTYEELNGAIENYIEAVQKDMFKGAFAYGFTKGVEAAKKKNSKPEDTYGILPYYLVSAR